MDDIQLENVLFELEFVNKKIEKLKAADLASKWRKNNLERHKKTCRAFFKRNKDYMKNYRKN